MLTPLCLRIKRAAANQAQSLARRTARGSWLVARGLLPVAFCVAMSGANEWSVNGCWSSFTLTFKSAYVEREYVEAHDVQSVKNCRPLIEIVCTVISVLYLLGISNPSNAHRLQWQQYNPIDHIYF